MSSVKEVEKGLGILELRGKSVSNRGQDEWDAPRFMYRAIVGN